MYLKLRTSRIILRNNSQRNRSHICYYFQRNLNYNLIDLFIEFSILTGLCDVSVWGGTLRAISTFEYTG